MALYAHQDVLREGLDVVKDNATTMVACSAQPTTRTEAVSTYALADVTVTTSDFTWSSVAGVGERLTVGAKSGITIDATGSFTHLAIVDGSRLLIVTTTASAQQLYSGNLLNLPSWAMTATNPV